MIDHRVIIHFVQSLAEERLVFVWQFYLRQSALYVGIKIRATLIDLVALMNVAVDDVAYMLQLVMLRYLTVFRMRR